MYKLNPFTPNSPTNKGMFVGRFRELETLHKSLMQTKNSNPNHLLILGERGIGKTSLLNVAQMFANGEFDWEDGVHCNFLTVRLSLTNHISLLDFALLLKNAIEREIRKNNPEVALLGKTLSFLARFEVAGVAYNQTGPQDASSAQLVQEFIYSLIDTIKALNDPTILDKKKDGLVILIDEADSASKELNLGSFLKNLSESLISEGCNNVLFILTGLPDLRNKLIESHESSLRLFQQLILEPLSKEDTAEVITRGIEESGEKTGNIITIESSAQDKIHMYSEGYPHFIQQIGYSVFDVDVDNGIDEDDVMKGFFGDNGALEQIGQRYYVKLYYKDINVDSQREILRIISDVGWNDWVSRPVIKKKFLGNEPVLNNGIKALIKKGIIIPRDGVRGQYRLQWASFAFWIRFHNRAKRRS